MTIQRAYLAEKENSFNFGSEFSNEANIPELFSELTRRLESKYDINKGVLVLRTDKNDPFSAVSTWHNGAVLEGLAISLPSESSLFARVADDGRVYSEAFTGTFSGNFFEKKLLLDDNSKSFVIHPLKHEGQIIGMIAYSSESDTAFTMIEEGSLNEVTEQFSKVVREKMLST